MKQIPDSKMKATYKFSDGTGSGFRNDFPSSLVTKLTRNVHGKQEQVVFHSMLYFKLIAVP